MAERGPSGKSRAATMLAGALRARRGLVRQLVVGEVVAERPSVRSSRALPAPRPPGGK